MQGDVRICGALDVYNVITLDVYNIITFIECDGVR